MSTVSITVEDTNQAFMLADWLKSIRFVHEVNIHHSDHSLGNANAVKHILDSIKTDNVLTGIADPVAYQKMIRDEWN